MKLALLSVDLDAGAGAPPPPPGTSAEQDSRCGTDTCQSHVVWVHRHMSEPCCVCRVPACQAPHTQQVYGPRGCGVQIVLQALQARLWWNSRSAFAQVSIRCTCGPRNEFSQGCQQYSRRTGLAGNRNSPAPWPPLAATGQGPVTAHSASDGDSLTSGTWLTFRQ